MSLTLDSKRPTRVNGLPPSLSPSTTSGTAEAGFQEAGREWATPFKRAAGQWKESLGKAQNDLQPSLRKARSAGLDAKMEFAQSATEIGAIAARTGLELMSSVTSILAHFAESLHKTMQNTSKPETTPGADEPGSPGEPVSEASQRFVKTKTSFLNDLAQIIQDVTTLLNNMHGNMAGGMETAARDQSP